MRKRLLRLSRTERAPVSAYAPDITERVYATLGALAAAAVRERGGAIVDATFGTAAARAAFAGQLGGCPTHSLFAECRAPVPVLEARAMERAPDPDRVSDATPDVVRDRLAAREPPPDVPPWRRHIVHTDLPPDVVLDTVLAWLDRRLEDRS